MGEGITYQSQREAFFMYFILENVHFGRSGCVKHSCGRFLIFTSILLYEML